MDFDPLVDSLPSVFMREMARLWEYTGFVNSAGQEKPVLTLWDNYRKLPLMRKD